MPEYLAPGVYVEEVSFRSKSIEGVSTTTTGFIGPARYGPIDLEPDVVTGLGEFERLYGDGQQLDFSGASGFHNYLWQAARAFFTEGGKRLYVARVFKPRKALVDGQQDAQAEYLVPPDKAEDDARKQTTGLFDDGHARKWLPTAPNDDTAAQRKDKLLIRARFPGATGNVRVRFIVRLGQNILGGVKGKATVTGLTENDVVWIGDLKAPIDNPPGAGGLFLATFDATEETWRFAKTKAKTAADLRLNTTDNTLNALDPEGGHTVRVTTITVMVLMPDGSVQTWENLPPDPAHTRSGSPDSLLSKFAAQPSSLAQARGLPIVIGAGGDIVDGLKLLNVLTTAKATLAAALNSPTSSDADRSVEVLLAGGNDGQRPKASEYEGKADLDKTTKTGLKAFEDLEDISIVAAPGSTYGFSNGYGSDARTIMSLLIAHAQDMRYRIAVLDSGEGLSISEVRAMRAQFDSTYGAFYFPWVRVLDPITRQEINLPPSGFVAGIYARNDITRAVIKAPANEVVNLAIGFELPINKSQQDILNPEGINCFRYFEGRGYRLWGARTISSDPEWKYVNLRRYFAYLERSIDRGTQWAVFEPNGEQLWATVRRTIEDFLFNEWQKGALLGDKPEKAFFVRCDRSTMTQNDLDNGRLICLIGLAPLRPAEYVIFRIGQWTADAKR